MKKTIFAIVGPTASGKTQLSIDIALQINASILNVDSRQIYKDFVIGSSQPTPLQLSQVPHFLVGEIDPISHYNAKDFENDALKIIQNHSVSQSLLLAGGTGLYFQAIEKGFDEIPVIDTELRKKIQKKLETKGLDSIVSDLKNYDPEAYSKIDIKNPRRVSRALEVFLMTGKSIVSFWGSKKERDFKIFYIGIDLGWEVLEKRIAQRTDEMLKMGWIEETENLMKKYPLSVSAFQAIGYPEVIAYLQNTMTFSEMRNTIVLRTRQYAKRQLTWFRKNPNTFWIKDLKKSTVQKLVEAIHLPKN